MISVVIGGDLEDFDFRQWVSSLKKIKILSGNSPGTLAEYATRCTNSSQNIIHRDIHKGTEWTTKANDPVVFHFPTLPVESFGKLVAVVEVALDFGLDIQVFTYGKQELPKFWQKNWPEPKQVHE